MSKGFQFTFQSQSEQNVLPSENEEPQLPGSRSSSACSDMSLGSQDLRTSDNDMWKEESGNGVEERWMNSPGGISSNGDDILPLSMTSSSLIQRSSTPEMNSASKRTHTDQKSDMPPSSPSKKRPRTAIVSSVQKAIDNLKDKPGKTLLKWFNQKSTEEKQKAHWAKVQEEAEEEREEREHWERIAKLKKENKVREQNKLRKRHQRSQQKEVEIKNGVRSPRGTKRKVRQLDVPLYTHI